MSYDVSAISTTASVPLPPHSSDARALQNDLEGVHGPIITSVMFSSDGINNITFPPGDREGTKYTYATFTREQYAPVPNEFSDSWELVVPVQIPTDLNFPRLQSLEYTLKYASARDRGSSTLQSDIVLTTASLPSDVRRLKERDHEVYRDMENSYSPRMVRKDVAWNLATSFGVKPKGGSAWSHYIDHQRITLGIPLAPPTGSTNLYFTLSVQEYPSPETVRSIAVEIASQWKDLEPAPPGRIVRSPSPQFVRPQSQQSIRSLADSIAAPPQRPQPVDVPVQAPRAEIDPSRYARQLLYERIYAPPADCCDEDIEVMV